MWDIYLTDLSPRAGIYYADKNEDEKRQVILELFDKIVINNGEVTVKMKRFLARIAEASDKSREVLSSLKISDRTIGNTPGNGVKILPLRHCVLYGRGYVTYSKLLMTKRLPRTSKSTVKQFGKC